MTTASTTSRPAAERRAVTLLELLIVIGIIVVLLGLAVPTVATALDRRRVASVAEEVLGSLLMARAHAQSEGVTVEVILVEDDARARRNSDRTPLRLIAREIDLHAPPYDDEEGPPALRRTWADLAIEWPLRISIVGDEDDEDLEREDDLRPSLRPPSRADNGGSSGRGGVWSTNRRQDQRQRLAVFAADGSAIVAPRLRISDPDGRALDILVNPFTGLPRLERDLAASAVRSVDDSDAIGLRAETQRGHGAEGARTR